MTVSEVAGTAATIIAALGGGAALVAGFSSWVGKIWAERLMESERAKYRRELEELKAQLTIDQDRQAAAHREKLALYKEAFTPLIDFVAHIETNECRLKGNDLFEFEKQRLQTTAMLGMFAAIPVFEAYNDIVDYLLDCGDNEQSFEFSNFRRLGFALLGKIRQDVGIAGEELVYRGSRY